MAAAKRRFTLEERIFIIENWIGTGKKSDEVKTAFEQAFPNTIPPSRQAMYELAKQFHETGSVMDATREGRPKTGRSCENVKKVSESFSKSPRKSQRRASSELNVTGTTLQRIMKELTLRNWKRHLLQALNEDNPDRREEFCN
ncbi:Uncharacterised protein r2_g260 [Pycnogonum litorale]